MKKSYLKNKKSNLMVLLLLLLSSGYVVVNDIFPSSVIIASWSIVFLFLLFNCRSVNIVLVFVVVLISVLVLLCSFVNDERVILALYYVFPYFVSLLVVLNYTCDEFNNSFCDVLYILSIISLVLSILYYSIPSLNYLFVVNGKSGSASCLVFFVSTNNYRNRGMFWEPGAFQSFLNLALLLEIKKTNIRLMRVLILVLAVISTFSTTGFAVLVLNLFMLINRNEKMEHRLQNARIKFLVIVILFVAVGLVLIYGDALFSTSSNTVFGKIAIFINNKEYSKDFGNRFSSASIRFFSVTKPILLFLEKPLLGFGYEAMQRELYNYTFGMNTCTFVNYFAVYGGLYGLLFMIGYFYYTKKITDSTIEHLVAFLIMFLVTATEDYVNNPFFLIFVLFGIDSLSKRRADQSGSHKKTIAHANRISL